MALAFEPVTLDRQAEYGRLLEAAPARTSDYAFANIWGWAEHYGLEWAFQNGLAWIRQTKPAPVLWAPVGPWDKVDWAACSCLPKAQRFTRVPEELARNWKNNYDSRIRITAARDHWDYVYERSALVDLPGPRFAQKKELLEAFRTSYVWNYSCMTPDCVEEVLAMQADWVRWHEEDTGPSPALAAENHAIERVLQNMDRIQCLLGGTLRVGGRIVAYTVAECLCEDTLVIHFEKGDTRFTGSYQAINQTFLEHAGTDFRWVNREQDLGEDGLRKAKLSYNPARFEKKYDVVFDRDAA